MPELKALRAAVRRGLYPLCWIYLAVMGWHVHLSAIAPETASLVFTGTLVAVCILLELVIPYQRLWSMTWRSFFTDLVYIALNASTLAAITALFGLAAIRLAGDANGIAAAWPFWAQCAVILLVFEAINYTIHRAMHEGRGRFGAFLWRVHAAHHMPDRVYVVMHAVFHPLNAVILRPLAMILPVWVLGYDPLVVTLFVMVNGMHGLVSHFNVDLRMGWFNYLFVGPELHRYHHSANFDEAKNYGATLSVYDQIFGTFVYRPGVPPERLGVPASLGFPHYRNILSVMKLPFAAPRSRGVADGAGAAE